MAGRREGRIPPFVGHTHTRRSARVMRRCSPRFTGAGFGAPKWSRSMSRITTAGAAPWSCATGRGGASASSTCRTGRAALGAWLAVRGLDEGALFPAVTRHGRFLPRRRLSPHAVWDWLARLHQRAGVAPCAPHDLRRSFVSDLLDGGADLSVVQQLAGHSSPTITVKYDR